MSETLIYHLLPRAPEKTVKKRIIYYYSSRADLALAKTMVTREREARHVAFTRDATTFVSDSEVEPCDQVIIMPDVAKHHRDALENCFRGKVDEDVDFAAVVLQPSPPAPVPAGEEKSAPPAAAPVDLSMMTKKELRDHAATRGIALGSQVSRRDDLIAAIEAAHA